MIDFPAAPTVGQRYLDWAWNGSTWVFNRTGFTFVSDGAPSAGAPGQTWYQTSTGISYVWNLTWVPFAPGNISAAVQVPFTATAPANAFIPVIAASNVQAAVEEVVTDTAATYALGIVATGIMVPMAQTTINTSVDTPVTQLLSYTPLLGRRYRIKFRARACQPVVAPCNMYLRCVGSNNLAAADTHTFVGGVHVSPEYECVFDGTGVPSTYQINAVPGNTIYFWNDQPVCFFNIQDIGPAR